MWLFAFFRAPLRRCCGMDAAGAQAPAFVCPCSYTAVLDDTYASVLVVGTGQLPSTLQDITTCTAGCVANTLSYCSQCRRITPCMNSSCSAQENIMHWPRQHAFYTACADFIKTWPTHARGTKLRHRNKKQRLVEEAGASAQSRQRADTGERRGFRFRA